MDAEGTDRAVTGLCDWVRERGDDGSPGIGSRKGLGVAGGTSRRPKAPAPVDVARKPRRPGADDTADMIILLVWFPVCLHYAQHRRGHTGIMEVTLLDDGIADTLVSDGTTIILLTWPQ